MRSRIWLAVGLACALAGQAVGKPEKKPGKPPSELVPLVTALNGNGAEQAVKAAEKLGGNADPSAHDALLDALAFGLPAKVAVVALPALGQHPAPPDVAALRRYATHHDPAVRGA